MNFGEDYKIASGSEGFIIRKMSRFEIQFAIESAAKEGWNPGLYDAESFYKADPNGFFIGTLNRSPIGCISAVSYGSKFGFIGFYIVKPEFREKGYGIQLWNVAINYLKKVECTGLDGVVEQQKNYLKSRFELAYKNIRFEGLSNGEKSKSKKLIVPSKIHIKTILRYDNKFFPAERNEFLKCWIRQPDSFSYGWIENDKMKGYGVIRKCKEGYKIGPLFSDNYKIAEEIFVKLISSINKDTHFYLDIPEVNEDALKLVRKYKMKRVFETARMYSGKAPDLPVNKIFGVTTFELG